LVLKPEHIIARIKELDTVVEELSHYKELTLEDLKNSLSKRWTVERGLIAGANLIFDIADHILASKFHLYPETYEDSLRLLFENGVISKELFTKIDGLGGFRNILVHDYLGIDLNEEYNNFQKALIVFKEFAMEILLTNFISGDKTL
jgi:uncharacterized protein YutE (UPF0331/DUF86 family)